MWTCRQIPTHRKNIPPPSSGLTFLLNVGNLPTSPYGITFLRTDINRNFHINLICSQTSIFCDEISWIFSPKVFLIQRGLNFLFQNM
jgi:hypothetical protein